MDTTAGNGIDSNGTLTISGVRTEVWTANTADNEPLDADKTVSITVVPFLPQAEAQEWESSSVQISPA